MFTQIVSHFALGVRLPLLAGLFIGLFLCTSTGHAQNLILNGGFETATQGVPFGTPVPFYPTTLNNWTATNVDGEFIFDLTRAHSGTGFLSVLQNAGGSPGTYWLGGGSSGGYDRVGQVVNVTPNTSYTLAFWYRGGDGSRYSYGQGDLKIHVEQIAPTNVGIANLTTFAGGAWTFFSTTITTGPTATQVIVQFSPQGPTNIDVWVDDVTFGETAVLESTLPEELIENQSPMDLTLYPNPAQSDLYVEIPSGYDWVSHKVVDAAGRMLDLPYERTDERLRIVTAALPAGMYVLLVQKSNSTETRKFMVKR